MLHRSLPLKLAAVGLAIFLWFWVMIAEHGMSPSGDLRIKTTGVSAVSARLVPVILETTGALPPTLAFQSAQLDPPMVTVVGSSLRLSEVTLIRTEPVDLSRASGSIETRLRLVVPQGFQVPNAKTVTLTLRVSHQHAAGQQPSDATGPGE
jgi:YbbR domain-containing protein